MTRSKQILALLTTVVAVAVVAPAASAANDGDSGRRAFSTPAPAAMKVKVEQDAYKIRKVERDAYKIRTVSWVDASQTTSYIPLTGRSRG